MKVFLLFSAVIAALLLTGCKTTPSADKRLAKYAPEASENECFLYHKANRFKLHPNRQYALFNSTPVQLPAAPFYDAQTKVYSVTPMTLRNIIDPLMTGNIKRLPVKRILLDPGHGGHDAGALGKYSKEKDLNFRLALEIKQALSRAGFQVAMTRTQDVYLPLAQRVALVQKHKADLFISIHHNSSKTNLKAAGIDCFAFRTPRPEDTLLAALVQEQLIRYTKRTNRGVKFANFAVLRNNPVPALLIEAGFISNAEEEKVLNSPQYRQNMAAAVAEAVLNFAAKAR